MPKPLALSHVTLPQTVEWAVTVLPSHRLTICVFHVVIRPHCVLKLRQENKDQSFLTED